VVRGEGAAVKRVVAVVDREEGGEAAFTEHGVELRSLFKVSELLQD
jgi:orotate phosphoribosyltransferase